MKVTIEKCQCGHPSCNYYGVSNGTFYQGNGWDKETAEFVAWCFNNRHEGLHLEMEFYERKRDD